jgi:uncharacterized protein
MESRNAGEEPRLEALPRDECLRLLANCSVGRLAVVVADQPTIFPVNYAFHNGAIVFRSDPGTKLHGALGHRVAFEIDNIDNVAETGWSVVVLGSADPIDPRREPIELAKLAVGPWTGPKERWVRIRMGTVSGRRIVR